MQVPFLACLAAVLVFAPAVNAQGIISGINYALNRPTWQSADYLEFDSSRAVDGDRNGIFPDGSCSHTSDSTVEGWWAVDLEEETFVNSIVIYNRIDAADATRLTGVTAVVSNDEPSDATDYALLATYTECDSLEGDPEEVNTLNCGRNTVWGSAMARQMAVGRYVYLYLPLLRDNAYLTLCEVEVFGYPKLSFPTSDAFQSSVGWDGVASRALDENHSGTYNDDSCTHTQQQEEPWWGIDLGAVSEISTVVAYNRLDICCQQRTYGLTAIVSNTRLVGSSDETPGDAIADLADPDTQVCDYIDVSSPSMAFDCPEGTTGRYLYMFIPRTEFLSLCEVEVYGREEICTPFMRLVENTNVNGATPIEGIEDREGCNDLCLTTEGCVAVDYNKSETPFRGYRCWLHLSPIHNEFRTNRRVDHYEVVAC